MCIRDRSGVKCFDTFTGFKFMAEKKNQLEEAGEGKVIFSYEESYGYMVGDYVRDKDCLLYTSHKINILYTMTKCLQIFL